jgi:hypothetical protein
MKFIKVVQSKQNKSTHRKMDVNEQEISVTVSYKLFLKQ